MTSIVSLDTDKQYSMDTEREKNNHNEVKKIRLSDSVTDMWNQCLKIQQENNKHYSNLYNRLSWLIQIENNTIHHVTNF